MDAGPDEIYQFYGSAGWRPLRGRPAPQSDRRTGITEAQRAEKKAKRQAAQKMRRKQKRS